ncbi:Phosphatidylinositol 3,5-bisphosphate-binding protein [Neophaeococcomyces mojaviensis]|uniref:Phosphatidylinositol 3,5-bisphosphate-binding protein n=1 Tax=Neophaeococcomyces mojaviensis TaxID=3383035 RepID=A0ACC3AK74_9EURO|nr:Phosphatidylinositol 3,5-bisphosphate-binding protein [Knufia sp. JES_112]
MDTRPIIDESQGPVSLCASFNTDSTCFSIGTDTGFCVFNSDPCELRVSRNMNAGIGIAEMLGNYNYLALVGGGKNPRWPQTKVIIWDDAKQKTAVTLEHKTALLRVRLTRTHIAVALQNSIHLYQFSSPPTRLAVFETADNHLGLCCLGTSLLAFPGRSPGKIQLVELKTNNVSIIPAHASALRALDLSSDGTLLASASETGTLIRVFSTQNCAKLAELRRGVDPAFIFSIAISPDTSLLAVTSDKSTLHVFDLTQLPGRSRPSSLSISASPSAKSNSTSSRGRSQSPNVSSPSAAADDESPQNKWGFFSKIPLLPRIFSDTYSIASTHFEMGDEGTQTGSSLSYLPALGSMPARPMKGIIGWRDNSTILVIGTGRDGRWERFRVSDRVVTNSNGTEELKKDVWKDGWKRYLGS